MKPNYMEAHLLKLVGKRIVAIVQEAETQYSVGCYGLRFDDETVAWIQCDPECNGPGHLDIETPTPRPPREKT